MQSEFLAITITVAVAITLCVWHIFTQLENMVPKSERERIKAERLAEEARRKQIAEVQSHEVLRPEPQQPPDSSSEHHRQSARNHQWGQYRGCKQPT